MKVEVLYFDGCPGHERMLPWVRELAGRAGAELELRRVETPEAAQAERFLGSPTVRVDGTDVDPDAADRTDYGLQCRFYRSDEGDQSTAPPDRLDPRSAGRRADRAGLTATPPRLTRCSPRASASPTAL